MSRKNRRDRGPARINYKRSGKCPVTGKLSYPTEIDAAIALGKAQTGRPVKGRDGKVEQRHYACDFCGGHHLTSMARAS